MGNASLDGILPIYPIYPIYPNRPNNHKTNKTNKTIRIKTDRTNKTIRKFVRNHHNRPKVLRSQSSHSPYFPILPALSIVPSCAAYMLPRARRTIPIIISIRSRSLVRRLRSPKSRAPQAKVTTTDERRIIDTMAIIEPSMSRAW